MKNAGLRESTLLELARRGIRDSKAAAHHCLSPATAQATPKFYAAIQVPARP